jgi:hypothetical protein
MQEYWNCIKISDIKFIGGCGGSYGGLETHQYFKVKMKDDSIHTLHFISHEGKSEGEKARLEIKKLFNAYNNIPETFLLYTNVYGRINGQSVHVGYEVENILNQYEYFSLNEVEELRKQFKLKDNGERSLVYIQVFKIEGDKIESPIEERWIKQLETMGYDISLLKYTLKENKEK